MSICVRERLLAASLLFSDRLTQVLFELHLIIGKRTDHNYYDVITYSL